MQNINWYENNIQTADFIMNRSVIRSQIVNRIKGTETKGTETKGTEKTEIGETGPILIAAPSGAGSCAFAASCLLEAGYTTIIIVDALDMFTSTSGNIQQHLYPRSKKVAYIYKDGSKCADGKDGKEKGDTPVIYLSHEKGNMNEKKNNSVYYLEKPTQYQWIQLFRLYTGAEPQELTRSYSCTNGSMHGLTKLVWLYRYKFRSFNQYMSAYEENHRFQVEPSCDERLFAGCKGHKINVDANDNSESDCAYSEEDEDEDAEEMPELPEPLTTSLREIYNQYELSEHVPSVHTLCDAWPLYTTDNWRIVVPYYPLFTRLFLNPAMPIEMIHWRIVHLFDQMPGRGKTNARFLDYFANHTKYGFDESYNPLFIESAKLFILYSVYSFRVSRELLEIWFRDAYVNYHTKIKSGKNKVTAKTKKESMEWVRQTLCRDTCSWNEKLFRKWMQYTTFSL